MLIQKTNEVTPKKKILTHLETLSLFKDMLSGDKHAITKIINANERLVWKIARSYSTRGVDVEDLVQEGKIGLLKAIEKFDPERGIKFSTYATWWVRQAIGRYVSLNSTSATVPAHIVTYAIKVKYAIENHKKDFGNDPSEQELADVLGISVENVKRAIAAAGAHGQSSKQFSHSTGNAVSYGSNNDGSSMEDSHQESTSSVFTSKVNDPFDDFAEVEMCEVVANAFSSLQDREKLVLLLRFGLLENKDGE